LFVNPTTASTIVTEWAVGVREGDWLLGPTLHTPGFLQNVPRGSLDGAYAISPSLSLLNECQEKNLRYHGPVDCRRTNADAFRDHFKARWDGEEPFPAAYYYYDAVVLLAMGLELAAAQGDLDPKPSELQKLIVEMTNTASVRGRWNDLGAVFGSLSEGTPVAYVGAAAEYEFDMYGAAVHQLFDTWRVKDVDYVAEETLQVRCVRQER
jgi:neutral amino acid transport system substrate-binding protein